RLFGKADKVLFLIQQLLQPAAERIGAAFLVEITPGLVRLAVICLYQSRQQLFQRLGIAQLGIAQGQAGGLAVRLLVNLMNNTVVDGHTGIRSGRTGKQRSAEPMRSAAARYSSCRYVANHDALGPESFWFLHGSGYEADDAEWVVVELGRAGDRRAAAAVAQHTHGAGGANRAGAGYGHGVVAVG